VEGIGVVGLGIVGGTVAGAIAEAGFPVRGYDLYLGIGELQDLCDCGVVFLCVPTPLGADGSHDLTELWAAIGNLVPVLADGTVVVVKSTIPPGTCDRLSGSFPSLEFAVVPEFLVATRTVETFTHPDRVVIGARKSETASMLADLMATVARGAPTVIVTPIEAELIKLCSNAMLAAKVAMANDLAGVCQMFDVEWPRIQAVVGLDRRIGPDHITVTRERGFGGTCLPKDLDGLVAVARSRGYVPAVLESIAVFNRRIREEAAAERPSGDSSTSIPALRGRE
jgi:UDPglucose 6-dehydrogenase